MFVCMLAFFYMWEIYLYEAFLPMNQVVFPVVVRFVPDFVNQRHLYPVTFAKN